MTDKHDDDSTVGLAKDSIYALARFPSRYENRGVIGEGATGLIFRAYDSHLQRDVAIKVLLSDAAKDKATQERFLRETRALALLDHPNVVRVLNSGMTENGGLYCVMEFLEGESLAAELKQRKTLAFRKFFKIIPQILAGLKHIHSQKIIHRDLKPSNIMLCLNVDENAEAKVIDFGIARLIECDGSKGSKLTQTNAVVGSPTYMSPEQCRAGVVTHLSDIYSLGCIMHECLSGKPPHQGETTVETMYKHMNEVPQRIPLSSRNAKAMRLANLIYRCLEKNPEARPQSAKQISFELAELVGNTDMPDDFLSSKNKIDLGKCFLLILAFSFLACCYLVLNNPRRFPQPEPKPVVSQHAHSMGQTLESIKIQLNKLLDSDNNASTPDFAELNRELKQVMNKPGRKDAARQFAALQMKADILEHLAQNDQIKQEQIECQKLALGLCAYSPFQAAWCNYKLAVLYNSIGDLNNTEKSARALVANKAIVGIEKNEKALNVPENLWSWEGSSREANANLYLGIVACKKGKYAAAEKFFVTTDEIDTGVVPGRVVRDINESQLFWNAHRSAETLRRLEAAECALHSLSQEQLADKNDLKCVDVLATAAAEYHFDDFERRVLRYGISKIHNPQLRASLEQRLKRLLKSGK